MPSAAGGGGGASLGEKRPGASPAPSATVRGAPSRIQSATSSPIAGESWMPDPPAPAAKIAVGRPGAGPTWGRPSGLTG